VLALAGDVVIFQAGVTAVLSGTNGQQAWVENLHAMALGATTGAMLWEQELPPSSLLSLQFPRIVVVGGTAYMPTRSGQIVAVDVETGHHVWERQLPGVTLHDFDESTRRYETFSGTIRFGWPPPPMFSMWSATSMAWSERCE